MAKQASKFAPQAKQKPMGVMGQLARLMAFFFLMWVGGFVVFVVGQQGPARDDVQTDAIAVLTGGPGRVARGLQVLQAGQAKRLLVSGVDPQVKPREFVHANQVSEGLFNCCVDLGFEAKTTRTNATEIADWMKVHGFRSVRLVTAGYHMPRARAELEAKLPDHIVVVSDGVRAGLPLWAMLSEYAKFQAAWMLLRVRPAK